MFRKFAYHRKIFLKLLKGNSTHYYWLIILKNDSLKECINLRMLRRNESTIRHAIGWQRLPSNSFKVQVLNIWSMIVKLIPKYKKSVKKKYKQSTQNGENP